MPYVPQAALFSILARRHFLTGYNPHQNAATNRLPGDTNHVSKQKQQTNHLKGLKAAGKNEQIIGKLHAQSKSACILSWSY